MESSISAALDSHTQFVRYFIEASQGRVNKQSASGVPFRGLIQTPLGAFDSGVLQAELEFLDIVV